MNLNEEIEKARRNLPYGYSVIIEIEKGSVSVTLSFPDFGMSIFDDEDDVAENVFEATQNAISHYESEK